MVVIGLAILAAAAAVWSAVLLYRSTRLDLDPGWNGVDSIEQAGGFEQASQGWTVAGIKQTEQASALNQKAAWWAIAAAVLGALATIVGLLPLPL